MYVLSSHQKMVTNKVGKKRYYDSNKEKVQRARIIKALNDLAQGKLNARKPSEKTLAKYGLLQEKDGKQVIVIPDKFKTPVINYTDVPKENDPQVINVVRVVSQAPVQAYNDANVKVTGAEIKNWVWTVLSGDTMKGDAVRSKETLTMYANTPRDLFKIYSREYDENSDCKQLFKDVTTTIQKINDYAPWEASGTKSKHLSGILYLIQNFHPLKLIINKDVIDTYDAEYKRLDSLAKAEQAQKNANRVVFEWSVIRRNVLAHYPAVSYEALIMHLYNDITARDDFGCIMAYKPSDVKQDDNNYCLIDRQERTAKLFMNKYKTVRSYKGQVFTLSQRTTKLILQLHPDNSQSTLFPPFANNKLGSFIRKTLSAVPLLKDEKITINYLRHSIVSSALARMSPNDPNYAQKLQDLAEKSFHRVSTQPTYTNKLKDETGKIITINPATAKAYDAITTVIEGGGEPEAGDEATSGRPSASKKPPPKKGARKPASIPETVREDEESDGESEQPAPKKVDTMIGTKIRKRFGNKWFSGRVIRYKSPYYLVRYSDGDEEEMTAKEVREHSVKK